MRKIYFESDSFVGGIVYRLYKFIESKKCNQLEDYTGGYRDEFTDAYAYSGSIGRFTESHSDEHSSEWSIKTPWIILTVYSL